MNIVPERVIVAIIVLGIGLVGTVQAQSGTPVRVEAEVQSSEVGTEELVTFTVRVQNVSRSDIKVPDAPSTTNLVSQQSTPSTQRSLSFEGGQLDRSLAFEWQFRPLRAGDARIHPVEVTVQGETHTTEEIRIRVVSQSQRPASASEGSAPSVAEGAGETEAATLGPQDLFIQATATDDEAYQNEQVTVEYHLFYRPNIRLRHSRLAEAWDAAGFWREELDVPSRPTPRTRYLGGRDYETIVLKRVALFPTRAGSLRVDPLRIETEAQVARRTNWSDGATLRSRYEPVDLASDALPVTARSLPPSAPQAFDGAVGQFSLSTHVEADSAEVGEAVQLTASLEGTGNLATLSPPHLELPDEFEGYEPEVQTNIDRSGNQIGGRKDFVFTLVPRANGSYTIPPVTFAYFDPETEQYETLRSEPTTLHVTGDEAPRAESQTGEGLPVGDITGLIEDDAQWGRASSPPLYRQPWAYAALLVPVFLAAGGLLFQRRRQAAAGADPAGRDEALEKAQHHLNEAHRHLRNGDVSTFYGAVERAVLTFLGRRLDLSRSPAGLTRADLDRHLSQHDVPEADREALHELLDACEQAQFTPMRPSHDSMQAALDHAQSLLLRLDDAFPVQTEAEPA